ncbi:DUF6518 family protein [Streptomyces sp. NPDC021212]|uniref:DUF6518 family protein n=1 Tax=Streptomyces sp. NPDC021212 TaxID=3365118 RepID=UPI0037B770CC
MRSPFLVLMSAAVAGAIVGICGPLFISTGGQPGHVVHVVLSAGWSWAALAFCVGMSSRSKRLSAGAGVISLVVAVLAYYLTKAGQGEFLSADLSDPTGRTTYFSWGDFLSGTVLWCFFACLLGPILGVSGNISINGPWRLPSRLLVPLVAIAETSMRLTDEASRQAPIVSTTWSVIRVVAVIAILVLVGHAGLDSWRRRTAKVHQG